MDIIATNSHMKLNNMTAIVLSGLERLGDSFIINPIADKKSPTMIIT